MSITKRHLPLEGLENYHVSMGTPLGDRIKLARKYAGLTQESLGEHVNVVQSAVQAWENGRNEPDLDKIHDIAEVTGVAPEWLTGTSEEPGVDIHSPADTPKAVARRNQTRVPSSRDGRTRGPYEPLTERVFVIGTVQAGAWREAYHLPDAEWPDMYLLPDARYPGVTRWALKNEGNSMNRRCSDGGIWVFVRLTDLAGIGPQADNYVIVERTRADGLVEATCKQLKIINGKAWLCPDSHDESFRPFPVDGEDGETVQVIGLVTDVQNRL